MSVLFINCSCGESLVFNRPKKEGDVFYLCPNCWHIMTFTVKSVIMTGTRKSIKMFGGLKEYPDIIKKMKINKNTVRIPLNSFIIEHKKWYATEKERTFMYDTYTKTLKIADVRGLATLFYKRKDY